MTQNKRIFWNIVATYCRSLYSLVIGICCGRWTLQALGHTDFGLMGLVGGLIGFLGFFNGILSSSISRYYAVMVGEARTGGDAGLEKCHMWFTTGIVIHTIIPLIIIIIGYPIGEWAVRNYLTIPADRIECCVWVWRFTCFSGLLSMMMVPINAMYMAKQYIAELTIYSVAVTTMNACFQYYMVTHPGVWITKLALWNCVVGLLPTLIISIRAFHIFPECRVVPKYFNCWRNALKLCNFAFWNAWGTLGAMLRDQGISILVNKYFGPKLNAGMAVGGGLSGHTQMLSGSMMGAFSPAIYNAWGAGDYNQARRFAYQVCKIGTLLTMVFALPLSLEVDEVLRLWLKNPPEYASGYCILIMAISALDKTSIGCTIAINAKGKIALFQAIVGTCVVLTFPIAFLLTWMGLGVYAPGYGMLIAMSIVAVGRIIFGQILVGMNVKYWCFKVFIPLLALTALSWLTGLIPRLFMPQCFWRIVVTTGMVEILLIPFSWFIILDDLEREYVLGKVLLYKVKLRSLFGVSK